MLCFLGAFDRGDWIVARTIEDLENFAVQRHGCWRAWCCEFFAMDSTLCCKLQELWIVS